MQVKKLYGWFDAVAENISLLFQDICQMMFLLITSGTEEEI